jgi:hypothetical protein
MIYAEDLSDDNMHMSDGPIFVADDSQIMSLPDAVMSREDHIKVLKERVVRVTFTKVDGTVRTMDVTLRADMLPPQEETTSTKAINPDVVAAYDIDAQHWKSFRVDSVLQAIVI